MAAGFARRKHAHEDAVGSVAIDDHRPLLESLGIGEDNDRRRVSGLGRRDTGKSG